MKRDCLTITFAVFLLLICGGIQAQPAQTKLNQVELLKQLIGNWKSDAVKDTVWTSDCKPFGKAIEATSKTIVKDKVVSEGKGIIGYDKKNDKLVECDMNNNKPDISIYSIWFTAPNKFTLVPYGDVSNPEKASFVSKYEFKSPDLLTETDLLNNKVIGTYTLHRIK